MLTERAWAGGPLRKIGSGNGKPSKYVCDRCGLRAVGIYRSIILGTQAETWVCAACRSTLMPKQEIPEGIKKYQERRKAL